MTRKYDTLIHFPGYGRRELRLSGHQRTIVVSKNYRIVEVEEAVSPSPLTIITKEKYGKIKVNSGNPVQNSTKSAIDTLSTPKKSEPDKKEPYSTPIPACNFPPLPGN